MSSSDTRLGAWRSELSNTGSSLQGRLAWRSIAAVVVFILYLTYTYFGSPGSYVLYAFTGFAPPDLSLGSEPYFEYVFLVFVGVVQEDGSLLVNSVPWLVLLVGVSVGIAIGATAVIGRLSGSARGAYLTYAAAFLMISNLLIEPTAGAQGLYLYQAYRLLQLDLLSSARLLLFATFLFGFVLTGTVIDVLYRTGPSGRAETR